MRVTACIPEDEHTNGFPLDFSKTFWLLQEAYDFHLFGYVVIPTENIAGVRFGKFERAMDRILDAEGADGMRPFDQQGATLNNLARVGATPVCAAPV